VVSTVVDPKRVSEEHINECGGGGGGGIGGQAMPWIDN
jgi:hypothetical protein